MTRSPVLSVKSPNDPLVGLLIAFDQFGWFSALNASTRSSSRLLPRIGITFRTPISSVQVCGLRNPFRGCTPNEPAPGRANAAGLNHAALVVNGVEAIVGSPTRFQN